MRLFAAASFLIPAAVVFAAPLAKRDPSAHLAPLSEEGEHIDDSYIVVFKKDVNPAQMAFHLGGVAETHGLDVAYETRVYSPVHAIELTSQPLYSFTTDGEQVEDGGVTHVYIPQESSITYFGYAGKFSPDTLEAIRASPEVAYVERDQKVYTQDIVHGVDNFADTHITTELSAPWGLARISHRATLHLSTFTKYLYDDRGGEGVTAYVIDNADISAGINVDHVEFGGRARWGKTIPKNDVDKDGNGHGTHCAGTIASRKYGVAKAAEVVAVKVLGSNGSGSMSDVVGGVVWAAEQAAKADADARKEVAATGKTKHKGSVANMSLGGGKAQSLDDAVNAAVEAGLHFAVAAGNDNKDACDYSPARAESAVTVGASTLGDERAYFSNHGKCVDIFAPGLNILSTWNAGNQSTNTISGTSMASPHICGLLTYLLSLHGTDGYDYSSNSINPTNEELSTYAKAYSLLPKLAQTLLPTPQDLVTKFRSGLFAPVPPKDGKITPKQLKKALIGLASGGLLKDLPSGTPNLLAFSGVGEKRK